MLAPLPPLTAYRLDCARSPGSAPATIDVGAAVSVVDPEDEARWLRTAVILDRAARERGSRREASLRQFLDDEGVHPLAGAGIPYAYIANAARARAEQMEDWAFLRLATTTLAAVSAVLPDTMILERGRVIAQRARAARNLGEKVASRLYYEEVEALGVAGALPELLARAWVGQGLLAQVAGNIPLARGFFQRVVNFEDAGGESISVAHQGLMVAAAQVSDFDAAVDHAWSAYEGAASKTQQDAMLVDLAQVLLLAGQPQAASCGFAAALARHPHPRNALPAFGGAALAAVGGREKGRARAVVRVVAARVESLVSTLGGGPRPMIPYQSASALVEVSEALRAVGETVWSSRCAAHATQIAAMHSFHQLSHRLESPSVVPVSVPPTPVQRVIAKRVEALDGAELVGV